MARWLLVLVLMAFDVGHSFGALERVLVSPDRRGFVLETSQRAFIPWGVNYDHDGAGKLLEDYWVEDWPRVVEDFSEIKALGANVVRIHLQLGKFLEAADRPNAAALKQLQKLVALAEETELYLDVTGLGCYHKADVPAWYDALDEAGRWSTQAVFWEAVAKACASSPAIFFYDLMNEPVVPGGKGKQENWLGPPFAGKHFVQFITREPQGRDRPAIAQAWIRTLVAAIKKHDQRHLITVGMVDWSLDRPGLTSGFVPQKVADELDLICVHVYPERGKLDEARKTIAGFQVGKPIIVEETFPLRCSVEELEAVISDSQAVGWISFYWGESIVELRRKNDIGAQITANWLEAFQRHATRLSAQQTARSQAK